MAVTGGVFDVFDDVVDDGDDDDDVERGIKFCLFCLIQELIKRELKLKQLITRSKRGSRIRTICWTRWRASSGWFAG